MELDEFLKSIDWNHVKRIHTARRGQITSFSVEVDKKHHVVTIGTGPDSTSLTVSNSKGQVLVHVVQQAGEMMFYTPKPGSSDIFTKDLQMLAPMRLISHMEPSGPSVRGA